VACTAGLLGRPEPAGHQSSRARGEDRPRGGGAQRTTLLVSLICINAGANPTVCGGPLASLGAKLRESLETSRFDSRRGDCWFGYKTCGLRCTADQCSEHHRGALNRLSKLLSSASWGFSKFSVNAMRFPWSAFSWNPTARASRPTVLRVWKWGSKMISVTDSTPPGFRALRISLRAASRSGISPSTVTSNDRSN
jgi:hypothetical protein